MKKSFMYIFLLSLFIALWNFITKYSFMNIYFIKQAIPVIKILNEESMEDKTLFSYINILKYKLMSEDIFIELPEDFVELIDENVQNEVIYERKEEIDKNHQIEDTPIKSVTLDWKNEIRNETKYKVDIEKLKKEKMNFSLKKKGTEVIIYHTHTTESYSKDEDYEYVESGDFRTLDKNANVVKIGKIIKDHLKTLGITAYHDTACYDYPSYNLSYSKAGKAILSLIKKYTGAKIVLDIHRDALSTQTEIYRPIVNIGGEDVAQILLVVGTNQGGLSHPKWKDNLKFALKLQEAMNNKYPGLCRYVSLRKERFNQQVTSGAIIVEMGATGNKIGEVEKSAKLFSEILAEVAK